MNAQKLNGISRKLVLLLSLLALATVLPGFTQPRGTVETDEGTGAHIFQLSVAALAPAMLLFFITADWKRPWPSGRPLILPLVTLLLAFSALYYLEHFWLRPR